MAGDARGAVGPGGVALRTGQQFKLGNVVFTFEGER